MGFHGAGLDHEFGRDLCIRHARGEKFHDLQFPGRQLPDLGCVSGGRVTAGELRDHPAGDGVVHQPVPSGEATDGVDQFLRFAVLEDESVGPGLQRTEDVGVQVEGGDHEHGGASVLTGGNDLPGGRQTVPGGHPQVHAHHVGAFTSHHGDGLPTARGLTHDGDVAVFLQQNAEPRPHHRLVVHQHHSNHRSSSSSPPITGTTSRTRQPPSGVGPVSRVPPAATALSCITFRPTPPVLDSP